MFKLIGVLLLLYSSVISAKATTGNELYEGFREGKKLENHQPANTYKVGMAYGVVIGLVEMDALQNHTFCISPEVTNGQIFDVVLNYLEKHPESRHKSGAILASFAIWEGFPCPVKKDE